MIYSRYGTKVTLINKDTDGSGRVRIWAICDGMESVRDYSRTDLMADEGMPEIDAAVARLPLKTAQSPSPFK